MRITVIHNTFRDNPYIRESVVLNLKALQQAGLDYQYIVFNDNGDKLIKQYVEDLDIEYCYSDINYGHRMCSGGWIGAIPLIKGDLIHNTGQDDVFSALFYQRSLKAFVEADCDLVYSNGFKVKEDLTITGETLGPLDQVWNYNNPRDVFNQWFGVSNKQITRSNNHIPAPGTIYKADLHREIGTPDVDTFRGVCDFEYWARVLFYQKKVVYLQDPTWLYRLSQYTTSLEVIDGKVNERDLAAHYHKLIKQKYQKLLDNE